MLEFWSKRKDPLGRQESPPSDVVNLNGKQLDRSRIFYKLGICCNECTSCLRNSRTTGSPAVGVFFLSAEGFNTLPQETVDLKKVLTKFHICVDLGWALYKPELTFDV